MLAAVTLFESCSQEEIVSQTGGESLVSFTVTTPELGSRAAGDGKIADKLYYAVYDKEGKIVANVSNTGGQKFSMSDNITLHLLNGEEYSILFWAKNVDCAATFDSETKTLSVPTTMESNNEAYDAFYAYVAPFTVTGSKQETVKMYRPFAQMNIATTARDITGINTYFSSEVKKSQLKVKTATKMNLTNGELIGDESEVTYTFTKFYEGEFPVSSSYEYLAMNYLLVGAAKELKNVTLELAGDDAETVVVAKEFKDVPVQRNYRTNIYGNLFTSQTDWSVTLLPEFGGEYTILKGNVTLEEDLVVDNTLLVNNGDVVLNLNGKKIINKLDNATTDVIVVSAGSSLTINGEGTIEAVTGNDGFTIISEGTLTINGGTYKSGVDANGDPNAVIYARGNGKVYVNGGNFPNDNKSKFVLNKKDADRATTTIEVRGGTFGCFNPGNNAAEQDNTNFLASGYSSVQVGDNFVVAKGTAVADKAALATALANGGEVSIVTDIESDKILKIEKETTVYLYGNKVTSTVQKAFEVYANATFKDGIIEGASRCVDTRKAVEVTLENVTLIADEYNTSYGNPQPLTIGGADNGTVVTLKNSNISAKTGYGIISFVQAEVNVTNSTIGGYSALYVKPGAANSTFNFVNSTLKGSTASNDVEGNSFTTIAVRDDNTTVYVDKDSKVIAEGKLCSVLSFGGSFPGEESSKGSKVTLAGSIKGDILDNVSLAGNQIYVNETYKTALETEGFACTDSGNGLVKVTAM
jgi:hypothetical protein